MNNTGKIYIVGVGPGAYEQMSGRAIKALGESGVIVGYKTYIELLKQFTDGKEVIVSGMRKEVQRCRQTLQAAGEGKIVSLVSSGDAGIYGMAGIMLEVAAEAKSDIPIEVVPGISAFAAAAALLGAPVMHDFAVISLSDLLTDFTLIKERIKYACLGDFVICLYNPKSKQRVTQIEEAVGIMRDYKQEDTPVGIVKNAYRDGQQVIVTRLKDMLTHEIDMLSVVIIGNSKTTIEQDRIITPRGYTL